MDMDDDIEDSWDERLPSVEEEEEHHVLHTQDPCTKNTTEVAGSRPSGKGNSELKEQDIPQDQKSEKSSMGPPTAGPKVTTDPTTGPTTDQTTGSSAGLVLCTCGKKVPTKCPMRCCGDCCTSEGMMLKHWLEFIAINYEG